MLIPSVGPPTTITIINLASAEKDAFKIKHISDAYVKAVIVMESKG